MKLLELSALKENTQSRKEIAQLKSILSERGVKLEHTYRYARLLLNVLKKEGKDLDNLDEVAIYNTFAKGYDWVHVRLSDAQWKQLGLNRTLYGQARNVNGTIITYGRWHERSAFKSSFRFKHELDMYEHVLGMLHEMIHTKEGDMAVSHSFLYGYDKLYSKRAERYQNPKRYVKQSSMVKALDYIFNTSSVVKAITPLLSPTVIDSPKTTLYIPNNFIIQELVSKAIYEKYGDRAWQFLDERLLKNLQWLRDNVGALTVNDWYWGGDRQYSGFDACEFRKHGTSQHNHGRACDSLPKNMTVQEVRDFIKKNGHKAPYPNMWVEDEVGWIHMDVRASDIKGVYLFKV